MGKEMLSRFDAVRSCNDTVVNLVAGSSIGMGFGVGAKGGQIPGFIAGSIGGAAIGAAAAPAFHKQCMAKNNHEPASFDESISIGVTCTIL